MLPHISHHHTKPPHAVLHQDSKSQYIGKTATEWLSGKAAQDLTWREQCLVTIMTRTCGVLLIDCSLLDGGLVSSSKWSTVPSLMVCRDRLSRVCLLIFMKGSQHRR